MYKVSPTIKYFLILHYNIIMYIRCRDETAGLCMCTEVHLVQCDVNG